MHYTINLSAEDVEKLTTLKTRYQGNRKVLRRLRFLEYRNNWMKGLEIKKILEVSIDTMTDWAKKFIEWWFEAICHLQFTGKRVSIYDKYQDIIQSEIDNTAHNSYKELRYVVEQKTKTGKKPKALYRFCKKKWIPVIRNVI